MYTIFVDMTFKARHQLTFEDGTQEPLHEHDWKVCAAVSADRLNKEEMVIDFEELKSLLEGILRDFRGGQLTSMGVFENRNPSAENLARIVYAQLAPKLPNTVRLSFVEITEAPGCRARYIP
ncbi:MAG: 6-carboxytetrahydropterin synthase [Planctomycetales bacterium]|nr:6-carboxytetrahydropterin synthase [Planctomycetales bacterium]